MAMQKITPFLWFDKQAEEADTICIIDKGKVVSFGTPERIKRDLVQEYVLIDADDRAQLRQELGRLELRSDGEGPFRVHVDSRHTHAALKAIDTPLTLVRTHMPSLEDAYLEIVGTASE